MKFALSYLKKINNQNSYDMCCKGVSILQIIKELSFENPQHGHISCELAME